MLLLLHYFLTIPPRLWVLALTHSFPELSLPWLQLLRLEERFRRALSYRESQPSVHLMLGNHLRYPQPHRPARA